MIRLLVLDVDGTLTDGGIYYDSTGNELKKFGVKDGAGLVLARSGLATRQGLTLANGVGLIDTDYRGEILCSVVNLSSSPITVRDGDRIAQLMVVPVVQAEPMPCETLDPTERGAGGFGSTGRN